ncbi:MAG: immunity 22 family protein [Treponema sp.]|jgi:hypothetical protein|nr:immunity 22 family protein [Treponema sp.]
MSAENNVSIWFGKFDTEDEFETFLKKTYNEDGDSMPSPFVNAFQIGSYDADFQEAFFDNDLNKSSLEDVSYSEHFLDKIEVDFSKYNATILLYNYKHDGKIKKAESVDFYGVLGYEED